MTDAADRPSVTTDYRFAPIPEALLYDTAVDHLAVRVYGVLARHGMDPDSCFPSHRVIAERIGIAQRSVQRPLRALEERGWIARVERHNDRGDRISDGFHVYTANARAGAPPALVNVEAPRVDARTLRVDERGQCEREQENESQKNEVGDEPPTPAVAEELCYLLADKITEHRDGKRRPKVTSGWIRDMDLLIRRGPTTWAEPKPIGDAVVRRAIDWVFTTGAVRDTRGFAWADQIESAGALRRHWDKLADASRRAKEQAAAGPARPANVPPHAVPDGNGGWIVPGIAS